MPSPFSDFDFSALDNPEFREDSVREELVAPLIKRFGYSATGQNRIVRSRRLQHPYVYIGSQKYPISIIPDYLLVRDDKPYFILDAKAPNEDVAQGKNVEQAYSYAIHKDIRVPIYGLCNGRRLTVFHVSHWPALLDIDLRDIEQDWDVLHDLLAVEGHKQAMIPTSFRPDFGLAVKKLGLDAVAGGKQVNQLFLSVDIVVIARMTDDLYTISAIVGAVEGDPGFCVSFDFPKGLFDELVGALPAEHQEDVRLALNRNPFQIGFERAQNVTVGVSAQLAKEVATNEDESFIPFVVKKFF